MASAWARLAADVGDANATLILEKEWECKIPEKVIEAGLTQKRCRVILLINCSRLYRLLCRRRLNLSNNNIDYIRIL